MFTIIIATLILVLYPVDALAWGPGTHLETAAGLLNDIAIFSPVVIPLLKKYHDEFVYGMVSADVLFGKKYAGYLNHCHNWNVGWRLLEDCTDDRDKASAYGYLTHLASDIVAHNYYIPLMIIKSHKARMKHHTYWELRFDMHVEPTTWNEVRRVIRGDFTSFDTLLEKNLKEPIISFKASKRIFNSILLLQKFKQLRKAVELHSRVTQWPLTEEEVKRYKALIMSVSRDFLTKLKKSDSQNGDPTGISRLKYAARTRKKVRGFLSRGLIQKEEADDFIRFIDSKLEESIFDPTARLPESYEAMSLY